MRDHLAKILNEEGMLRAANSPEPSEKVASILAVLEATNGFYTPTTWVPWSLGGDMGRPQYLVKGQKYRLEWSQPSLPIKRGIWAGLPDLTFHGPSMAVAKRDPAWWARFNGASEAEQTEMLQPPKWEGWRDGAKWSVGVGPFKGSLVHLYKGGAGSPSWITIHASPRGGWPASIKKMLGVE